ncbi:hypothetical protein HYZ64_03145 [Candidatus Berkelbacteria bacterium]|nr:hypothetical protein [Candidatus Berkelbacteria bacterium]
MDKILFRSVTGMPEDFEVLIDCTQPNSYLEMIRKGWYDGIERDFESLPIFPLRKLVGIYRAKLRLMEPVDNLELMESVKAIASAGLKRGEIEHLLALGAQYPNLQRQTKIMCPDSLISLPELPNCHYAAVLYSDERGRRYLGTQGLFAGLFNVHLLTVVSEKKVS